jgi:DUF1680 family protein
MELMTLSRLDLEGEFDERVRRAIRHMIDLDTDEMRREFTHPSERWHWGADYMGRWLGAMTLLSEYTGEDYGVDGFCRELIGFQEADGSFGPFTNPHDEQEWFGMGRGLIGLLEYYMVKRDPAVLESARRLGDYYVRHYPADEDMPELCECYPSGLDGIVWLAHLTGDQKFLDLARTVAERSSVNQRCYYSTEVNARGYRTPIVGHTHCQLLTAKGMIDLNDLFGDSQFMPAVFDLHTYFLNEIMWISGGIPEFLQIPHLNETCSDVDWLRLNLQLWNTTGEQPYFELAENILLNQLYFDQEAAGGFCFWRGLQGHMGSTFDACCSHHGARALAEVMRYIYTFEPGVVQANLFLEGTARPDIHGQETQITCKVAYEGDAMVVSYTLNSPPSQPVTFRARVPEWAGSATLRVNGQETASSNQPGYVEAKRVWSSGDRVELRLPMKVRVVQGQRLGRHIVDPREVSVFYGPRLFCFVDTKNLNIVPPLVALDLSETIQPTAPDRLTAWATTVTGERAQITLTPLANIGGRPNGIGRIHSVRTPFFKVWLPAANNH